MERLVAKQAPEPPADHNPSELCHSSAERDPGRKRQVGTAGIEHLGSRDLDVSHIMSCLHSRFWVGGLGWGWLSLCVRRIRGLFRRTHIHDLDDVEFPSTHHHFILIPIPILEEYVVQLESHVRFLCRQEKPRCPVLKTTLISRV